MRLSVRMIYVGTRWLGWFCVLIQIAELDDVTDREFKFPGLSKLYMQWRI